MKPVLGHTGPKINFDAAHCRRRPYAGRGLYRNYLTAVIEREKFGKVFAFKLWKLSISSDFFDFWPVKLFYIIFISVFKVLSSIFNTLTEWSMKTAASSKYNDKIFWIFSNFHRIVLVWFQTNDHWIQH